MRLPDQTSRKAHVANPVEWLGDTGPDVSNSAGGPRTPGSAVTRPASGRTNSRGAEG